MDESGANRPTEEIPAPPPPRWRQQKHRGLLWFCFWVLFLTTPVAPFAANWMFLQGPLASLPISGAFTVVAGLATGILCASYILARLYSNTTTQLIVRAILFALLILLVYVGIAFAGCMMMLKGI